MNEIVTTYLSRVNIYISIVNIYFSDANIYQRPHAPQTRTLTGLSYTPNCGCKGTALF